MEHSQNTCSTTPLPYTNPSLERDTALSVNQHYHRQTVLSQENDSTNVTKYCKIETINHLKILCYR